MKQRGFSYCCVLRLQIKSFKDYWFIFRTGVDVFGRVLECYTSEKESKRNNVKDRILLNNITSVTKLDSSKQLCLYSNDGTVHTFEASSAFECGEWVFSLNAVLFGKGPDGSKLEIILHTT